MQRYPKYYFWTVAFLLLIPSLFPVWRGLAITQDGQAAIDRERFFSEIAGFSSPRLKSPFANISEPDYNFSKQQGNPFHYGDIPKPPLFPSYGFDRTTVQSSDYKLAVYYVIPSDMTQDQDVLDRIIDASLEIQAWYQVATGGVTWEFAFPEIVRVYEAQETQQYYEDHGNWWSSLLPEMGANGIPIWSPGTVAAVWAHGAGWWAGGTQGCGTDCGSVLLGVELFPEFNNPVYSGGECPDPDGQGGEAWPCVPVGAFAHELGHTLGLIHPADNPDTAEIAGHSIMQTHWNYPDEALPSERPWGFLRNERQIIRTSPFMKTGVELVQIHQAAEIAVNLPVSGTVPSVGFEAVVTANEAMFTNNTQGTNQHYWTFGDYIGSNEESPVHTYWRNGTYTATLRASNDQSMMGVLTSTIVITANRQLYLPTVTKDVQK